MRIDKIVCAKVFTETTDRHCFRFFLGTLAGQLLPCDVLVLDNASIHNNAETIHTMKDLCMHVVFLPSYSPQLNAAEYSVT